jgi:hypothetical protein
VNFGLLRHGGHCSRSTRIEDIDVARPAGLPPDVGSLMSERIQ